MKIRYYADMYEKSNEPKERIRIADILCSCGEEGKKILYRIFRKKCLEEQVRIQAGKHFCYPAPMFTNVPEAEIKSLWVDKFEVTTEKYYTFLKLTGYKLQSNWFEYNLPLHEASYPAVTISRREAVAYADWLGMRLPTAYEWEYFAGTGSINNYSFGENESLLGEYAWFKDNSNDTTHPVGQKKPNKWGLFDVYGNVSEWCLYEPRDSSGDSYRGGSFRGNAFENRSRGLSHTSQNAGFPNIGFRCVRDAE